MVHDYRSHQVFIACASGSLIGSLIALQLHPHLWWIGLLVGGLVGYIAYNPRAFLTAVPGAYRQAHHTVSSIPVGTLQDAKYIFRRVGWSLAAALSYTLTTVPVFYLILRSSLPSTILGLNLLFLAVVLFAIILVTASDSQVRFMREVVLYANPVMVYGYYPFVVLRYLVRLIGKFVPILFVQVHSELRVLCAVDAALGAAIGYYSGNVLLGAVLGGFIGLLDYEIISKRVLKVTVR